MKNRFTCLTFLLISSTCIAQIEWVGNHSFSEDVKDFMRTAKGQYVLMHGNGITVFDSLGNIVFDNYLYSVLASEMAITPDSGIVFFADFFGCDLLSGEIIKYDKNWNMEWGESYLYDSDKLQVSCLSDSAVFCAKNGAIVKMSLAGNGPPIWVTYLDNDIVVKDVQISHDGKILACTSDGLAILSIEGAIDTIIENLRFDRLELDGPGIYCTKVVDTLYRFTADFEPLDTFMIDSAQIADYSVADSFIWVLASGPKVYQLSSELVELNSFPLNPHGQNYSFISPSSDGVMVAGYEHFGGTGYLRSNSSAFIKSYGSDGSASNTQEDASTISVSLEGQPTVKYNGIPNFYVPYAVTFHGIKVVVENMGANILNSITLNVGYPDFPVNNWCPVNQRFSKSFGNLSLQLGESVELDWGDLEIYFYENPSGPHELCFWSSLPSHHLETNNANDVNCIQTLVASHEILPVQFSHFYNPVTDELTFELSTALDAKHETTARIVNPLGQIVYSERMDSPRKIMSLGVLSPGIYLLHIISENTIGVGRFAKY